MHNLTQRLWARVAVIGLMAAVLSGGGNLARAHDSDNRKDWVGSWGASQQTLEPPFVAANPAQFSNQTIRQIVPLSIGGRTLRLRLSNEFGRTPLRLGEVRVAQQLAGASILPGSDRVVTFGGQANVTIPAGAPMLSDPIPMRVQALSNLVVSLYLPDTVVANTFHSLGVQTTYVSSPGNFTSAITPPVVATTTSWFFLSGVSVKADRRSGAIVALGDSITDGFASTVDANRRWPNLLAARLQTQHRYQDVAVVNHGISGNRTLHDLIGPNALARFDRDVLATPGARWLVVLEGINNIGIPGAFGLSAEEVSAADIINGHRQLIVRARERGLKVYGATLTPFEGTIFPGYYSAAGEAKRQAVNAWIRHGGEFDAVIDFDRALRDPSNPGRLLPAYDSGDHLHPNDAGYQAMANAVDLKLFRNNDDDE
jgi:lysophospholipase L1-like esterase